jgi:hypothetical protein
MCFRNALSYQLCELAARLCCKTEAETVVLAHVISSNVGCISRAVHYCNILFSAHGEVQIRALYGFQSNLSPTLFDSRSDAIESIVPNLNVLSQY